jgi:flagellar protein FlaG
MNVAPLNAPAQAAAPTSVSGPAEHAAQNRELVEAVRAVNAAEMFSQDSELTFTLDRGSQRQVVRLIDRKTKEVIRQIPAEYLLRLAQQARASEHCG